MIGPVKMLVVAILVALQFGCETTEVDRYNRRDLYSPEPESGSSEANRQLRAPPSPTPEPKPQLRG